MNADVLGEVLKRLEEYEFKERAGWLRQGRCPACNKRELYTNASNPWVLRCGRLNNCGWEGHVKELYSDIFEHWSKRYEVELKTNPNAAADAYLSMARGFDLSKIKGCYTQEWYQDRDKGIGSATVRFPIGSAWWERLIDEPGRFGKKKARFKPGGHYMGLWWTPPGLDFSKVAELWLVEGIFDAIALWLAGVPAVALMSCNNYPTESLNRVRESRPHNLPHLVWALDGDNAGRSYIKKHAKRADEDGWNCRAALIPLDGKRKRDWNDLYQLDLNAPDSRKAALTAEGRKLYLHHGAVLLAKSATEKALLIYEHDPSRTEFDFEFGRRLYWFSMNLEAYHKAMDRIAGESGDQLPQDEIRSRALTEAGGIRPISNCYPVPLYFQENRQTDESWYYFRVEFPHDGQPIKNTFTAAQVSTASEFKKRLLAVAPGAMFSGQGHHLDRMMERRLFDIKRVETMDFTGYSKEHGCYLLGDVAVKDGQIYEINSEDYFDLGKLSIKSLSQAAGLTVNRDPHDYNPEWISHVWGAFGAKGIVALAFWFGSLFAEQIRALQKSYPFLEVVGEAGSGKSTLLEFLWKLFGRNDYEGFDPSKASMAGRARNFAQVAGMPVVLIESDRESSSGDKTHVKAFDWDELKTAYNGRSIRTRGVANGGNETYEPPFRGSIVIAQNAPVSASEAILTRIVHINIDRAGQNRDTKRAAEALERTSINDVSGFVLAATKREAMVMQMVEEAYVTHQEALEERGTVKIPRIVKCHAQLMALVDALAAVIKLPKDQHQAALALLATMAGERQLVVNSDHPMVKEFWDAFEYLNGDDEHAPVLNHSLNDDEIAVNLNHFCEVAAERRQQVPALRDLKKLLSTSRTYKYVEAKTVKSRIRQNGSQAGSKQSATVHCWVFKRGR